MYSCTVNLIVGQCHQSSEQRPLHAKQRPLAAGFKAYYPSATERSTLTVVANWMRKKDKNRRKEEDNPLQVNRGGSYQGEGTRQIYKIRLAVYGPEGRPDTSDVSPLSGISGLSLDSTIFFPQLSCYVFYPVMLPLLSSPFLCFRPNLLLEISLNGFNFF